MPSRPRTKKATPKDRIAAIYKAKCDRIQIPLLSISEIYRLGEQAIADGADNEKLTKVIVDYVEKVRTDKPKIQATVG